MTNQLTSIDFHGQTLLATIQDNVVYTALKPICENIGLSWNAQFERIKRDEVLAEGVRMIRTPTKGGFQEVVCLPLTLLNGWLFGVDTNRVKAEIRETLITYKRECYQALFDYWNSGVAVNPRATKDERKPLVQAVNLLVTETGAIYSNVWKMIHQRFDVSCVDELTGEQVHQAVEYVHKLMLQAGNKVNAPFVQNIIADTAHQNRMAQDELGQMMAHFGKALDHIAELQNRLKRQEVLIDGAKRQLVA
ncbi:P22_AR N-terminal domain [Moraxella lacunata]|uniref:P22_AR N-terminal domain n=1 Tax=Moraxella lacunata TaxID=477 RepID=A0A378QKJ7_MORLA|nr:phage antirepressor N-terminal domain-containing protein [Moraxella lacunata]STY99823.1 P22_AR N-terminal domain [Moraxella lacunata]